MEEIYLDKELKAYYMDDFLVNVMECENESWKLNDSLKEILVKINENKNIQTLYSKMPTDKQGYFMSDNESYIFLAISKEIEKILFRDFIPNITNKYSWSNDNYSTRCFYKFYSPRENVNYHDGERSVSLGNIGCLFDPDYFRVNHIKRECKLNSV